MVLNFVHLWNESKSESSGQRTPGSEGVVDKHFCASLEQDTVSRKGDSATSKWKVHETQLCNSIFGYSSHSYLAISAAVYIWRHLFEHRMIDGLVIMLNLSLGNKSVREAEI